MNALKESPLLLKKNQGEMENGKCIPKYQPGGSSPKKVKISSISLRAHFVNKEESFIGRIPSLSWIQHILKEDLLLREFQV